MFQFTYNEAAAKEGFSSGGEPIPTGTYLFEIKDTKLVLTKAGKQGTQEKKLSIKLVVADPSSPYDKRPVFLDLNILNNNSQAVEIAQKELNAICAVTKVYSFSQQDDENAAFELRGKFLRADVIYEDDGKYKNNRIKAVYDINGLKPGETVSGSSNMAPAPAPVAPPQFQAPQPAPQMPQAPVAAQQAFTPPAAVAAPAQPQQFAAPQPAPMPQMPQAPQAGAAANPFQPPQSVAAPAPAPMPQAWQPPAA